MSSLRMRCLEYIAKEGGNMPATEIADGVKETVVKVRNCMHDASKDELVKLGRDDVTGKGGYSLTAKGKARIVNGHQTVNGKQAGENKEASDAREAEAHVMSAPADDLVSTANDTVVTLLKRIEGLEQDREKQRTLLASKTESIAALEKEVAELQDCTADELVGTVAKLMEENAALRKQAADARDALEEAQRELMKGATLANSALMKKPIAWAHVWSEGFTRFDTEDAAREDISKSFTESNVLSIGASHLCAIIDTAELSVKWVRS